MSSNKFVNFVIDRFESADIIDAHFILSDLVEINLTDEEKCQTAFYDSMATDIAGKARGKSSNVPVGKRVE